MVLAELATTPISKGLPPPPKASGLLLAVCSALLVNTTSVPLFTAVLRNVGVAVVVVDVLSPEDMETAIGTVDVDVEDVDEVDVD